MVNSHRLVVPEDASALSAIIRRSIRGANPADVGPRDWEPVTLAMADESGEIVGGVYGATMWRWLMIDGLWVDSDRRGEGLGRELLLATEELAVSRGCTGSWLGTFDFQARGFYEAHGYEVFAELPGFPPSRTHFHLRKIFAESANVGDV